jgi:alpha-galactosidase
MVKVAMIGAGSIIFCKNIVQDMMTFDATQDAHFALMDTDAARLEMTYKAMCKMKEQNHLSCSFTASGDRREALKHADFVVIMIQVGGLEPYALDIEIPLAYGIDQCVGDTLGPGGIFRGLRHVPALLEIMRDVAEVSVREVIVMNYANPMAICCWAMQKLFPHIDIVGLCHGTQFTTMEMCEWIGVPMDECETLTAGINHLAWFLKFMHKGIDVYPMIWEKTEKEGVKNDDKYRFEIMKAAGYYMTETSGHLSEYLSYFRTREDLKEKFNMPWFGGETGAYLKLCRMLCAASEKDMADWAGGRTQVPFERKRSVEFASHIMNAKITGTIARISGNVLNRGLITNLPEGCCVEVPVFVDRMGLHASHVGKLPEQCAALCRSNISVQELAVKAALEGDREAAYHACLLDPLTSAVCAPHEIRNLVDEMFAAQGQWLPQFKSAVNTSPGQRIGRAATSASIVGKGEQLIRKWKAR